MHINANSYRRSIKLHGSFAAMFRHPLVLVHDKRSQPERGRLMDFVSLLNSNILLLFHPRIEQPEKMKLSLTIEDDD